MKLAARSGGVAGLVLALGLPLQGCGDSSGQSEPPPQPIPCLSGVQLCWEAVSVGGGFYLPVYRSHPIQDGNAEVTRAIIVVHGANRNPDDYFETMVEAVQLHGQDLMENTLVVAPHFQTLDDGPAWNEPAWTSEGWKRGDKSVSDHGPGTRISSYEAVDEVLIYLGNPFLFPSLESVVITGHSAGAQYAHRFAATSPMEEGLPDLRFRYIIANPSTYLYLGPERADGEGGFALPDRQACPDYNEWHYGFEDRNSYAGRLTEEQARDRFIGRDVAYLAGTADTGQSMLDMTCGAMLQGEHRYERALTIFDYMNTYFPENNDELVQVDGVGHSSNGMYQSTQGRKALFNW
ncbi:MAG: hypothetical protein PVJ76_03365 [Gemmatimonadota bacterium]